MRIDGGAGGGGGGGSFTPGPLLSGVAGNNNDAVLKAPLKGAIIFGNATPLWDRLNASGITGAVLQLTTGSGDVPAWGLVTGTNFGTVSGNTVFAGPTSPGLSTPTFRALVGLDLPFAGAILNLTDGTTIAVDATKWGVGGTVRVTIAADGHTFSNPTTPHDGQTMMLEVLSAASHTIAWDTKYSGATIPLPTTTTGSNVVDVFQFAYRSAEDLWFLVGTTQGGGGTGTVTSVGLSVPAFLSVAGSPVTTAGTLAVTLSGSALPATSGGTGQNAYTTGDLLYASATNVLSKLPIGSSGQFLKVTGGVPVWGSGGGSTSPAGSNTQVQFNDSGSFGADSVFVWDKTNHRLGVGLTTPATTFDLAYTENSANTPHVVITNNGTGNSSGLMVNAGSTGNPSIALGVSGTQMGLMSWSVASNFLAFANLAYSSADFGLKLLSTGKLQFIDPAASSAERFSVTKDGLTTVTIGTAAGLGLVVVGAASQSGDLVELQNSSNAVLAKFASGGALTLLDTQTLRMVTAIGDANATAQLGAAKLSFGAGGGSAVDVGLARDAAGILKVTDGSGGFGTFKTTNTKYVNLTDAATIATDAHLGNVFRVTITASRTLGNPSNPTSGQKFVWQITQDGTGGWTLSADTKFRFGAEVTSFAISTAANSVSYIGAIYDDIADVFDVVSLVTAY